LLSNLSFPFEAKRVEFAHSDLHALQGSIEERDHPNTVIALWWSPPCPPDTKVLLCARSLRYLDEALGKHVKRARTTSSPMTRFGLPISSGANRIGKPSANCAHRLHPCAAKLARMVLKTVVAVASSHDTEERNAVATGSSKIEPGTVIRSG